MEDTMIEFEAFRSFNTQMLKDLEQKETRTTEEQQEYQCRIGTDIIIQKWIELRAEEENIRLSSIREENEE